MRAEHYVKEENDKKYNDTTSFWEKQSATNDGVMLGYAMLHEEDIKFSKGILDRTKNKLPSMVYALDCGAGIGRVTKDLLSHYFENIHLVEPAKNFMKQAKIDLIDLSK